MKELIKDTLKQLEPEIKYSQEAGELVLGTGIHESLNFKYRKQLGGGPALGYFQMEPATFNDILENFLAYKPKLMAKIIQISGVDRLNSNDLVTNDKLSICMCRVNYFRFKEAIPKDLEGQSKYWKKYYNTHKGKGTPEEYIKNYQMFN